MSNERNESNESNESNDLSGKRFFGTDGVRGLVGQWPITTNFANKLGWALGEMCQGTTKPKVIVGKDTRLSGYMFEAALQGGLISAGADVYLLGPMPTPAVAYLTRTFHADFGVMISASHNLHADNGFKVFSSLGAKLSDDAQTELEHLLANEMGMVNVATLGRAFRVKDAPGRYIEYCKSTAPHFFSLSGLKMVVDCAHGATYHIAPNVFRELGAEVIELGTAPNGLNINADVGSTSPDLLQQTVIAEKADLGVAFDGDGDRVVMVDHAGKLVDGDDILYVVAKDAHQRGTLGGGVVGTLMSNFGLELAMKQEGIAFVRAKVGDRHVMRELIRRQWQLGGESSGHIIWRGSSTTGDGIVAALQVLTVMREQSRPLQDLLKPLKKYPQCLINIPLAGTLDERAWKAINGLAQKASETLNDSGRVLIRASGTEPLLRVMVEGEDQTLVDAWSQRLKEQVLALV